MSLLLTAVCGSLTPLQFSAPHPHLPKLQSDSRPIIYSALFSPPNRLSSDSSLHMFISSFPFSTLYSSYILYSAEDDTALYGTSQAVLR